MGRRAPRRRRLRAVRRPAVRPRRRGAEHLRRRPTRARRSAARTTSATRSTSPTTSRCSAPTAARSASPATTSPSVHQGSHSPDALSNNAHELLYATRCTTARELISTTLSRFGDPGVYERSCEPATRITTIDNGYPDGDGARLIPDRECVERNVLVPAGPHHVGLGAVREVDVREHARDAPTARTLARFDTELRRLQPEPLRERRHHDRPHAAAVLGDRRRRRPRRRRRLLGRRPLAGHRVRRPALAVRRHPPRRLPRRHDGRQPRRHAALVDRPVRRQRVHDAVPGRRSASSSQRPTTRRASDARPGLRAQPQPRRGRSARAELTRLSATL